MVLSRSVLGVAFLGFLYGVGLQGSQATASFEKARRYFELRQWDDAEAAASEALAADPRLGDAEVLLGLIATMRSQFSEAAQHFLRAVALQPENYRAHAYLGATYLHEKRFPEAASAFHKVLELDPQNTSANYNLGVIALAENSPAQALDRFDKLLRANPSDLPALIGAMECQLLLRKIPDAKRSAQELDNLLADKDPRRFQVASLLAQHGESAIAIPMMERARRAYPESYEVNYNLALACFQTGRFDRAADVLSPFTGSDGKAEALDLLGQIEEKRGHSAAAEAHFREASLRDPVNDDYGFDYGNSLVQHGKVQSAMEVFRSAAGHPGSWKLRLGLGSVYYLSGDYVSAAQELIEAVRLKPDSTTAYFLLGESYAAAERFQPAIETAFESYLKTAPRDSWAYYHYAMILRSGRNDPGAANALHEALRVNPNFAEAHLQLGILAVAQENTKAAIADLEEAVRLAPDLALAHYHLGLAYRKIGNQERARVELDRFRSLKDQDSYRSRVLESLAAVGR